MKRRANPEAIIQKAVCAHLRKRGRRGMVWFHVPNGGKRGKVEAAIFKTMGVKPGVSDLILLHNGRAYALELKADHGRPTEAQMQFISDWNTAIGDNGAACIAEGLDRALRTLEIWGLLEGANWGASA